MEQKKALLARCEVGNELRQRAVQVVAVAVEAHGPDLAVCVKHQAVVSHAIRRVVDGVEIGNADEVSRRRVWRDSSPQCKHRLRYRP